MITRGFGLDMSIVLSGLANFITVVVEGIKRLISSRLEPSRFEPSELEVSQLQPSQFEASRLRASRL